MKFPAFLSALVRKTALAVVVLALIGVLSTPHVNADTPEEQFQFATGLYEQKLWGLAAENLRKFLEANPNDANAKIAAYQLGAALYRATNDKGVVDYAAAAAAYEKALARYLDPKLAATARYELGDIYFNLKQYDKSVAAYSEFLKSTPAPEEAAEAQFGLAESYYALNKAAEAKAAYQAVLARYPQSRPAPYAQRALGFIAEDANDFAAAAKEYSALMERYPKSEVASEARLRLANAQLSNKQYEQAVANYRATLSETAATEWKSEAQLGLADALFATKDWSNAANAYREALALKIDEARRSPIQLRLADSYYNAKQYEQAVAAYAPLLNDKDAKIAANAVYFSGSSYFALKKYADAAAQYQKFINAYPAHEKAARAALRLGDAYSEAKDTARAAEAYRVVLTKYPKSEEAKDAGEALLSLAGQGSTPDAVEQAVRGLPPGPAASNAQLRLAQAAFDRGEWTKATTLAQTALAAKPEAATAENALYLIASAKLQAGDAATATTAFQKQLTTYPQGTLVGQGKLGLAWALLDQKKWSEAETAARGAVNATTKNADLQSWSKLALGESLLRGGKAKEASTLLAALEASTNKEVASQAVYDAALAYEAQDAWSEAGARWAKYSTLATDDAGKAQAHLRQGLALVKAKRSDEAIAAFDRAIAADAKGETGARALYESAWLAHDAKQSTQESERWRRLETEFPQSKYAGEAVFQQGEILFEAKSWPEAATAYRLVTEKYPQSDVAPLAYYKLGSALYNVSDWSAAAPAFEKAATFPKSDVAVESSFWAGESLRRGGKIKEAGPRYEIFLKGATSTTAPKEVKELIPTARLGLGQSLLASGDATRAASEFRNGLNGAKGSVAAELNFNLADALVQQKKYKEAATSYLKAASLSTDATASRARWNAAVALEQAGDKTASLEIYKQLAAEQPANEWTAKAQQKIKE